jgi:hypothetical protein
MQFYCLDPDKKKYDEICNFTRIKMDVGDSFKIWKMSVDQDSDYQKERDRLLKKLVTSPTPSTVDAVWYMFFATGDTNLLLPLYEVCGHRSISADNSKMFMDMHIQFLLEYKKRIDKLKEKDPIEPHIAKIIKGLSIVDKIIEQWTQKAKTEPIPEN